MLRDTDPPTGTSSAKFFIVFATIAALAVVGQAWTLARVVARSRGLTRPTIRRAAPLLWELGIAPLAIVTYPIVTGGLGWGAAFAFVPDLSLVVAVLPGLALLTGLARAFRLTQAHRRSADWIDPQLDSKGVGVALPNEPRTRPQPSPR